MTRRLRLVLAAGAIALVARICFESSGTDGRERKPSAVGKPRAFSGQGDSAVMKSDKARGRDFDRLSVKNFPASDIAALLNGAENAPRHFIAAFLMTGSIEILENAAMQFPSSPEVFYTMAVTTSDPQKRVLNLQKALSLDPNNSYLQLLLAGGLANTGERGAAVDLVKKACEAREFETFSNSIKTATRELALKAGTSAEEAAIISLRGEPGVGPVELLSPLTRLYDSKEFKEAAGEDAESLAVSIAVKFRPLSKTNPVVAMLTHRTEREALKNLPGDTQYGTDGTTVAMRLAEIENESQRLATNIDALMRLPDLSDNEWRIYVDKWSREGQVEALSWLAQLKPPE